MGYQLEYGKETFVKESLRNYKAVSSVVKD
jgi:hypothetical protein